MREISLHILDISENGISAGATLIRITVEEARKENWLRIGVEDNGKGIPPEMIDKVTDPFVTSRTTRRVGMGLSLLKAASERCEGEFRIESQVGKGTKTIASFRYDHIDRSPIGDMPGTIMTLIAGHPETDFVYTHLVDGEEFTLDTRELRKELDGLSLSDASVYIELIQTVKNAIEELRTRKSVWSTQG